MSDLIIDELNPGVQFEQDFRIFRDMNIAHIRPYIYMQGTLTDGDLQLEVLDGATVLETKTVNFVLLNAITSDTFMHGFVRFDFDSLFLALDEGNTEQTYKVRLSMVNSSLDLVNFVAAVRNWDIKIYDTYGDVVGGQAVNDMIEPLGLEIYEYRST